MTLNLASLWEAVCAAVPDRMAVTCGTERRTFAQLDRRADALGHHLVTLGLQPRSNVGLVLRHSVEYVEGTLGCVKARVAPVNVNYRYTSGELAQLFIDADLVAVFVEAEFVASVREVIDQCPLLRHVIVVPGPEGAGPDLGPWPADVTVVDYRRVADQVPDEAPRAGERSEGDTYVLYTGGTTGMPKGVVWRHDDFYLSALTGGNPYGAPHLSESALAAAAASTPVMTYLITVPLMHGAASYTLFTALFAGSHVVLMPAFDPVAALRLVERERVQIIAVVGDAIVRPFVDALVAHKDDYDLSSLRVIGSGGAILSAVVQEQLRAQLPDVLIRNSFGASESGVDGQILVDSDGTMRLQEGAQVIVVDSDHCPLGPGETGFLARSGHVPLGYYKDEAKTRATFPVIDGVRWCIPGDVARVELDGSVTVLGRGSGCINTGGEKVYPEEVEQALKSHEAVLDALVAGVPDERFGQRVGAVVQLRPGQEDLDPQELRSHLRGRLAGFKIPAAIRIVPAVRRSPSGKADYRWASATLAEPVPPDRHVGAPAVTTAPPTTPPTPVS